MFKATWCQYTVPPRRVDDGGLAAHCGAGSLNGSGAVRRHMQPRLLESLGSVWGWCYADRSMCQVLQLQDLVWVIFLQGSTILCVALTVEMMTTGGK